MVSETGTTAQSSGPDYRHSHLHKGADYDEALAQDPMDAFLAVRERALLRRALERWFSRGLPRYLDFACGTGRITELVAPLAVQSYGIDVSEKMMTVARSKCPRTTFLRRDITQEPAGIEPVHLVTAFRFFGNAEDALRRAALKAIHEVLVEDGILILDNHCNPWTLQQGVGRLMGHRNREPNGPRLDLNHRKLRRLLHDGGFSVSTVQGIGFWLFRARLMEPRILQSRAAALLERACGLSMLAPFSPAYIVVARKRSR